MCIDLANGKHTSHCVENMYIYTCIFYNATPFTISLYTVEDT
jgi:hypothetical protein